MSSARLRVDKTHKFYPGSARAAWYARLIEYDGKTVEEFRASCEANPPSTPKAGEMAGLMEPVHGWIRFFMGKKSDHPRKLLTLEGPY